MFAAAVLVACSAASDQRDRLDAATDTSRPGIGSGDTTPPDSSIAPLPADADSGDPDSSSDAEGSSSSDTTAEPVTLLELALFPNRIDLTTELGVAVTEQLPATDARPLPARR